MESKMSEETVRRFYETFAKIVSEREGVDITVTVIKKEADPDDKQVGEAS